MEISLLFWILYLIALVFSLSASWPSGPGVAGWRPFGGSLLMFILVGILGWAQFGAAIHR